MNKRKILSLNFQEFLLNAIHNVVHGSAHAATNLMHNLIFGEEVEKRALTAKEEVKTNLTELLKFCML